MQSLARTSTKGTVYSAAQVQTAVMSSSAYETWKWLRLDSNAKVISDVTDWVQTDSAYVTHDTTKAVARSVYAIIRDELEFDWMHDLIRPFHCILMPDGGFIEIPLGTFTLAVSPTRSITKEQIWRTVTGADLGQLPNLSKWFDTYPILASTSYFKAIQNILRGIILQMSDGSPSMMLQGMDVTQILPSALNWNPGDTRLSTVNTLLGAIAFNNLWFDENGLGRSELMPDYTMLYPDTFTFDATDQSQNIVMPTISDQINYDAAYNQILLVCSDPNRNSFSYLYENNDPYNPISIPNLGCKKLTMIQDSTIADLSIMKILAQRYAQQYSRVYDVVTLQTLPWPFSQNLDQYRTVWEDPEGRQEATFVETGWTHRCKVGEPTDHILQRILTVSAA